jgi:hypothetical protein
VVSNWASPVDDQRVRIESGRADGSEAVFAGLTQEQIAGVAGVRMTVDSVPRERAMVRVDVSEAAERDRGRRSPPVDAVKPQVIQALQGQMERLWNPPVTERPWGIGYLPGNERTAVVTTILEAGNNEPLEELRLVHASGDSEFDLAAMGAAKMGLQHWLAESTAPLRDDVGGGELPRSRALKLRAEFRLIKDIPLLNLIGPVGSDERLGTLAPATSSPAGPE